jgi:light-regulated signal transduction histidine kinase (bacteriophytochrome)
MTKISPPPLVQTAKHYTRALRSYVAEESETALMQAYNIARDALASGVQLAEYMEFHCATANPLLAGHSYAQPCRDRIDLFMVEFLSVYDMALQGYKNTVPQLQQEIADRLRIEAQLREKTAELAAERDKLDQLVSERTSELLLKTKDLEKTLAQLRQTNREQAEFTYAISHDLKSPSNTITMLSDELQVSLGDQMDAEAAELVSLIRKTSARMGRLVEDVLAYSRCLEHQAPLVAIDLNSVLAEVLEDLRYDIAQSRAEISLARMPPIIGEPMQVKLLFQNLISNAMKFRLPAQPVKVTISAKTLRRQVAITVRDNGIGIAPAHFDRIFGLFQRLHTHDAYAGSGIGLALCKRIIGNLGGTIRLSSQPGAGSAFTVSLKREIR